MREFSESHEDKIESGAATSAPQTTSYSSEEVLLIEASEDKVDEDWSALGFCCNILTVGIAICTCKHASPALLALTIKRLPLKNFGRRCGLDNRAMLKRIAIYGSHARNVAQLLPLELAAMIEPPYRQKQH